MGTLQFPKNSWGTQSPLPNLFESKSGGRIDAKTKKQPIQNFFNIISIDENSSEYLLVEK